MEDDQAASLLLLPLLFQQPFFFRRKFFLTLSGLLRWLLRIPLPLLHFRLLLPLDLGLPLSLSRLGLLRLYGLMLTALFLLRLPLLLRRLIWELSLLPAVSKMRGRSLGLRLNLIRTLPLPCSLFLRRCFDLSLGVIPTAQVSLVVRKAAIMILRPSFGQGRLLSRQSLPIARRSELTFRFLFDSSMPQIIQRAGLSAGRVKLPWCGRLRLPVCRQRLLAFSWRANPSFLFGWP